MVDVAEVKANASYAESEHRRKHPRNVNLTLPRTVKCRWPDGTLHFAIAKIEEYEHVSKTKGLTGASNLKKAVSDCVGNANGILQKHHALRDGSQEYVMFSYCYDPYAWKEDNDPGHCFPIISRDGAVFDSAPKGSYFSSRFHYHPPAA